MVLPAAYARLGELRRRQGRTEEALQLFRQAGTHPIALLGAAWMDLQRGSVTSALERVRTYLRRFPADALLERAPANELLVRIAAASGAVADACTPLEELELAASRHNLPLLRAALLAARGVLAAANGESVHAAELLDDAAALYEAAGHAWEAEAARRTLPREAADNVTLTRRELEVLRLIASGLSEREVADRLFISPHTAHRHLSNIRLKLGAATQAAAVAHALRLGLL